MLGKKMKDNSISSKIIRSNLMIALGSTVIADIVANVSSNIIHTSGMNSGKAVNAASAVASSSGTSSSVGNTAATAAGQLAGGGAPMQANTIYIYAAIIVVNAIFIAAFIFLAFKLSKRIARKISEPIVKMADAANMIADGNLNIDVAVDTKDETAALANSFEKIISSLRLLKADVNMLVGEATEGRLDTRADTSRHNGDYREIISGVNRTLDTVKAPLDDASAFINGLADGKKQKNISNTYNGYYAALIDNLNKVNDSIGILAEEAASLAEAGQNGDLEARGNESRLKGAYAQIIHGVNATFDSIKEPLDTAAVYISKIADGENPDLLENSYKGYYARLIDNLNSVTASLHCLMTESQKLVSAGQKGVLSVRGDTSSLKGSYQSVIDGFNKTLDSIVLPINEANRVLGIMAKNDFTVEMPENYNGIMNSLSVSINSLSKRFVDLEELFTALSEGNTSNLEMLRKAGKLSENDKLLPALIAMMQEINDIIIESNTLATAAVEGNLNTRGSADKFKGGFRQIIEGMNRTMDAVAAPIEESSSVLQQIARGDLTAEMTGAYNGEYNKIKTSLNAAISSFNELLGNINSAAVQVSSGSKQVSGASQLLSQGATEQASSIEQLTASIANIAAQTRQNAESASQASNFSAEVKTQAIQGNEKMAQMLSSMNEINQSSTDISKIIKVIDDIAFQTNILALNAAVEAARAGQYGKGFAVVAEEVRNLAGKSAEAVSNTTMLIENSISKVEAGTAIANETADVLVKIAGSAQKSAALVSGIAAASNEQAEAITQIDKGVTQVSTVVQTNSATAEESAASSEELSGQADILMSMVEKFKLKKSSSGNYGSGAFVSGRNTAKTSGSVKPLQKSGIAQPKITFEAGYGKY